MAFWSAAQAVLSLALVFAWTAPRALADGCPACGGTGACPSCGGQGYVPAPSAGGQAAAYGCTDCGGVAGNPYDGPPGQPGSGRCRSCGGSGGEKEPGPRTPPGPSPEEVSRQLARAEASRLNEEGVAHFEARRWPQAIDTFLEALGKWPEEPTIRANLENSRKALAGERFREASGRAASDIRRAIDGQKIAEIEELQRSVEAIGRDREDAWRERFAGEARERERFERAKGEALERMAPGGGAGRLPWERSIADPQVARIMRGLRAIEVPPPLPVEEVSLSWKDLSREHGAGLLDTGSEVAFLAWDLSGKLGGTPLHCKVVLIAGKVLIAGEDGAYVHLVKREEVFEEALALLKDRATSRRFAEVVRDLKETGRTAASADPRMVRAARAITDPALGSSGTRIAWDAMLSREALAAMVRKACIEVGGEMMGSGTEGLLSDLTRQRRSYEAARRERRRAKALLEDASDPARREALRKAVSHAEHVLSKTYRLERAGPILAAAAIGKTAGPSGEEGGADSVDPDGGPQER